MFSLEYLSKKFSKGENKGLNMLTKVGTIGRISL
jgi:hypothetical protein